MWVHLAPYLNLPMMEDYLIYKMHNKKENHYSNYIVELLFNAHILLSVLDISDYIYI